MAPKLIREKKFDLDSGFITKSPCRSCPKIEQLPKCSDNCCRLNRIQDLLAGTISCSNNFSEYETYSLAPFDY
jgi:hypothetical protein